MDDNTKKQRAVLFVAFVLIIGAVLYYFVFANKVQAPVSTETPSATTTLPTGTATTNDALDQDLQALDAQLGALESDQSELESAVNEATLIPN